MRQRQLLIAIVATEEALQMTGIIGGTPQLQISGVFEDALGTGGLEGRTGLVERHDCLSLLSAHFLHFYFYFTFSITDTNLPGFWGFGVLGFWGWG